MTKFLNYQLILLFMTANLCEGSDLPKAGAGSDRMSALLLAAGLTKPGMTSAATSAPVVAGTGVDQSPRSAFRKHARAAVPTVVPGASPALLEVDHSDVEDTSSHKLARTTSPDVSSGRGLVLPSPLPLTHDKKGVVPGASPALVQSPVLALERIFPIAAAVHGRELGVEPAKPIRRVVDNQFLTNKIMDPATKKCLSCEHSFCKMKRIGFTQVARHTAAFHPEVLAALREDADVVNKNLAPRIDKITADRFKRASRDKERYKNDSSRRDDNDVSLKTSQ